MTFAFETWCLLAGALCIGVALIGSTLKRLPVTTAVLYLGIGVLLGPLAFNAVKLQPLPYAELLERLTEIAVIVSLFTAGLKLRESLHSPLWRVPIMLAFVSMAVTVGMITLIGFNWLGLPLGAAVLLGAILAPTDPVLASDVQVENSKDTDRLRFGLTGEAGFNDGTAFPFVMLGLGLLGLHDIGPWGWKWLAVDVIWAIVGGLTIGAALGTALARLVVWLRLTKREAVGMEDFLALGLIALSYGLALTLHTYGFLAVFAAGLALRHTERILSEAASTGDSEPVSLEISDLEEDVEKAREVLATHPEQAPSHMAHNLLNFNEQVERLLELGLVVLLGGMLTGATFSVDALWLAPLIFLIVRPLSVFLGLLLVPRGRKFRVAQPYMSWFGIRGIGSLYYLFYAINHELPTGIAERLTTLTFAIVAISIVVHGLSVTPLSKHYQAQLDSLPENPEPQQVAVAAPRRQTASS